jgi:hypothetical protein
MVKVVGCFGWMSKGESSLVEGWKMACRSTAGVAVAGAADALDAADAGVVAIGS